MAYHSGYGVHGAWGGWGAADPPVESGRRGPFTLRERGGRDRCPGWWVSLGFLPSATRQRVPDFALSAQS